MRLLDDELRSLVIERDGNTCLNCQRKGTGRSRLVVRIINPEVSYDREDMRNLITLCPDCDRIADRDNLRTATEIVNADPDGFEDGRRYTYIGPDADRMDPRLPGLRRS